MSRNNLPKPFTFVGAACACLALSITSTSWADSPLTSTDLASAYTDLGIVPYAQATGTMDERIAEFLLSEAPTDQKAAVINALGWSFEGGTNAEQFLEAVAASRGLEVEDLGRSHLRPEDRFVLGYLIAMEDYLELGALRPEATGIWGETPINLLDLAAYALPDDFTVQYVRALVHAQVQTHLTSCSVFLLPQQVIDRFDVRDRNLRPSALASAQTYIERYEEYCQVAPLPTPGEVPANAELDMIYDVVRFGSQVVTGTHGGVVVWDAESGAPLEWADAFICNGLVVWHDAVWVGCDTRVFRWDGSRFDTYLHNTDDDDKYYRLLRGPDNTLLARYGGAGYQYDTASDSFVDANVPNGYEVFCRANGDMWSITRGGVHGPGQDFLIESPGYPGRDPRSFYEDALGRLWVGDFGSGLYRFDEGAQRFERIPGLDEKGTGVAVHPSTGRTFMLHYTEGVTIVDGAEIETVDLTDLENMRALLLDDEGTLWVAGWTQLVRLRETSSGWQRTSFSVME